MSSKNNISEKKIIGLTGTYCAGKNYVAKILEKRGLRVLDVDKLGHKVIETEKDRLLARFGEDILGEDGLIDRKLLGEKVFGKPGELAALEEIIHPAVNQETLAWIDSLKRKACVINAALLHRSSAFELLDSIIIVEAPVYIRLLRARKRDKLPWPVILKRFQSQNEFKPQYFKGKTDIYRVSNPSGCSDSGSLSLIKRLHTAKLEDRIDEILSLREIKMIKV